MHLCDIRDEVFLRVAPRTSADFLGWRPGRRLRTGYIIRLISNRFGQLKHQTHPMHQLSIEVPTCLDEFGSHALLVGGVGTEAHAVKLFDQAWNVDKNVHEDVFQVFGSLCPRNSLPFPVAEDNLFALEDGGKSLGITESVIILPLENVKHQAHHLRPFISVYVMCIAVDMRRWSSGFE